MKNQDNMKNKDNIQCINGCVPISAENHDQATQCKHGQYLLHQFGAHVFGSSFTGLWLSVLLSCRLMKIQFVFWGKKTSHSSLSSACDTPWEGEHSLHWWHPCGTTHEGGVRVPCIHKQMSVSFANSIGRNAGATVRWDLIQIGSAAYLWLSALPTNCVIELALPRKRTSCLANEQVAHD